MSNISLCLTSQGSDIRTSIYPPIRLDPDKYHEIALIRLETYNSIPNVNESNNVFRYKFNDTIYNIEIPPGAYELSEINDFIQRNLVEGASLEIMASSDAFEIICFMEGKPCRVSHLTKTLSGNSKKKCISLNMQCG